MKKTPATLTQIEMMRKIYRECEDKVPQLRKCDLLNIYHTPETFGRILEEWHTAIENQDVEGRMEAEYLATLPLSVPDKERGATQINQARKDIQSKGLTPFEKGVLDQIAKESPSEFEKVWKNSLHDYRNRNKFGTKDPYGET